MRKLFLSWLLASAFATSNAYPQASFTNVYLSPNPVAPNGNGTAEVWAEATGSSEDWWWILPELQTSAADLDTTWYNGGVFSGAWVPTGSSAYFGHTPANRTGGMWYKARVRLHAATPSSSWHEAVDVFNASGWWDWQGNGYVQLNHIETAEEHYNNLGHQWGLGHELASFYTTIYNTSLDHYIYRPYIWVSIYNQDLGQWTHATLWQDDSLYPGGWHTLLIPTTSRVWPGWNWVSVTQGDVTYNPIPGDWIYFYPPEVSDVVATSSSDHAGHRSSGNVLKLVHDGNPRQATIQATVSSHGIHSPFPQWSGAGVALSSGSTSTTYNGTMSTTATCTVANGISRGVAIELINHGRINRTVNLGNVQTIINLLNNALASKFQQNGLSISMGVSGTKEYVDYYNDGSRIGLKHSLAGNIDVSLPDLTFIDANVPCPTFPLAGATFEVEIAGVSVSGEGMIINDESKADPRVVEGQVTLSTGLTAKVGAYVGMCEFISGELVGSGSASLDAAFSLSESGDKVYGKGSFGVPNVVIGVEAKFEVQATGGISCTYESDIWYYEIPLSLTYETESYELYHFD